MLAYHCHLLTSRWNIINGGTFVYCFAKQLYFLFIKFNYGIEVENCNAIVQRTEYFQCSSPVFAIEAFGDVCLKAGAYYTRKLPSHQQQWKVGLRIIHECILYARFYGNISKNLIVVVNLEWCLTLSMHCITKAVMPIRQATDMSSKSYSVTKHTIQILYASNSHHLPGRRSSCSGNCSWTCGVWQRGSAGVNLCYNKTSYYEILQ